MAERRMFAKTIIDSDAFLDMPSSSQALYFHLAMRADDDGFINGPKRVMKIVNSSDDDLKLLAAKKFIIPFESGIVVIKHWKIHNYIQKDRYKSTVYKEEKDCLTTKENGTYTLCVQDVSKVEAQVRLGKDSIGKVRLGKDSIEEIVHELPPPKKINKKTSSFETAISKYTSNEDLAKALNDFIEMRKAIKSPLTTQRAFELMLEKLTKLSNGVDYKKIKILNNSIMSNWKGIFALKEENEERGQRGQLTSNNGQNVFKDEDLPNQIIL